MHWDGDLIIISITAITLGLGMPLVRAWVRRLDAAAKPSPSLGSGEVLQRLHAIEQSVESIAVEVERISENQRFTTKLLAGREAAPAASVAPSSPARAG